MENTFMIWLGRLQAQGASASALSNGQVLLQKSYCCGKEMESICQERFGNKFHQTLQAQKKCPVS